MRVLVEPAIFSYGPCGMTRYYASVCRGLEAQGVSIDVPLLSSNCDFAPGLARYTRGLRRYKFGAVMDAVAQEWFQRRVAKGRYDCVLVTSPGFDSAFLNRRPDTPFVMVVHDLMTCVTSPDGLYDAAGPGLLKLLALASRAARVICISDATRQALLQHGMVEESRVTVIRTGNLLVQRTLRASEVNLPERYLLFVGERSGRKGFYPMIRTLAAIFAQDRSLHLICTGRLTREERDFLAHHGMLDRVRAIPADDDTLSLLYKNALCLVYPSLYEGFGLPVIEAMHYGCPVVTTTRGALAEVAGDAALFFNPDCPEELGDVLLKVLYQPSEARRLAELGKAHAGQFSVDKMMLQFREELESVVQRR